MPDDQIPFNRPFIIGKELYYIAQAVQLGQLAGNGTFTKRCESWMEERFGAQHVLLVASCTAALEMSAILADIGAGDEVIMPSYTFASTANAFALRHATVRFVDIRADTLNIDEALIESAITDRTKAIVPVHYAGVACNMDAIMDIAERHDLMVIEDAAQGVNATYGTNYLGTIGHLGAFSFHETKNFISGEGGALVVNDERLLQRAETVREKGTNRAEFLKGEVDKYSWVDIGSSYLPSELVAAFLFAQLEEVETITRVRNQIFARYMEHLTPLADDGHITLPSIPDEATSNGHLFYLLLSDESERDRLITFLQERRIHAIFHYVPLHTSRMGAGLGYNKGDLPVTEAISSRLLRLPCFYELTEADQDRVVRTVFEFFGRVPDPCQ